MKVPLRRRALHLLDESISSLEEMISGREPREPRKLGRLFSDLRSLQLSLVRLEKSDAKSRRRFWMIQRRASSLIVKIAKRLSTS